MRIKQNKETIFLLITDEIASTVCVAPLGYSFDEVTVRLSSPNSFRTSLVYNLSITHCTCDFSNGFFGALDVKSVPQAIYLLKKQR